MSEEEKILKSRKELLHYYSLKIHDKLFTNQKLARIKEGYKEELSKHNPRFFLERPVTFQQFEQLSEKLKYENPVTINKKQDM